jgi:hypothetical protein
LVQAGFHTTGQGVGEHERGGGLEFAAEQIGGAGRLEAQGPPVLAAGADLGEFHHAPRCWPGPGPRAATGPLASGNRLMRCVLRTGCQPGWSPISARGGMQGKDHFCQAWMRPRARPGTWKVPGLPQ